MLRILLVLGVWAVIVESRKGRVGINLSGLEEGSKVPGKANYDFAVPGADEWAYFKSKNITLVRLPFKWERMQPNSSGPLSPVYLGLVHKQVQLAKNNR
jgi:endoglucanase